MKIADVHIHSNMSDGVRSPEDIVDYVEHLKVLNKIYITDHDNIEGAIRAKNYSLVKDYKIEVGIGIEVSSKDCHILALDVKSQIKKGMSLERTCEEIVKQGGFPIVAHPFNPYFWQLKHDSGKNLALRMIDLKIPFAFEVNGTLNYPTLVYSKGRILDKVSSISQNNRRAIKCSKEFNIPVIGASDAHMLRAIGSAYTVYTNDLISDIKNNKVNYGFDFSRRREGLIYLGYHVLFDPIPIRKKYKRKMLNIIPKAKSSRKYFI